MGSQRGFDVVLIHMQFDVLIPIESSLLTVVLDPCDCGVACYVKIVNSILAKHVREEYVLSKALVYSIDLTLFVDLQRSCSKDIREVSEDCLVISLEHRDA